MSDALRAVWGENKTHGSGPTLRFAELRQWAVHIRGSGFAPAGRPACPASRRAGASPALRPAAGRQAGFSSCGQQLGGRQRTLCYRPAPVVVSGSGPPAAATCVRPASGRARRAQGPLTFFRRPSTSFCAVSLPLMPPLASDCSLASSARSPWTSCLCLTLVGRGGVGQSGRRRL